MIKEVSNNHALPYMFKINMKVIQLVGNISAHGDLDGKKINFDDITKLISFTHRIHN